MVMVIGTSYLFSNGVGHRYDHMSVESEETGGYIARHRCTVVVNALSIELFAS